MALEPNTLISHYKILSEIGKGGMGEVYLAEDTELDRKAAIKFLSEEFSKDEEKINRFVQEAKAASALNHPNILTVYEIGTWEDTRYIATEYIEGMTLRSVLKNKESVPLNRVLKTAIQVAEALSAAHKAGIVHRDIKPENIMIREDGYVKVLDFGLAKLVERRNKEPDISLEGETKALVKTNPGVVMGTVTYMSPEQAQGKETDQRTDIWSLGVVLYEMLSGKAPFEGKTTNHSIVSILESEPKDLENVPNALQRIVRKALTKDPEMRYQTAKDFLIDLKNLRRELDLQGELERSVIPNTESVSEGGETFANPRGSGIETSTGSGVHSTQNLTSTSSLEYAVMQAKSHKFVTALILVLVAGAIGAAAYFAVYRGPDIETIDSIAVMPFSGIEEGSETQYLSDGLTESIIFNLSRIPQLKVLPASTVFSYRGKEFSADSVAEDLGVRAVLISRVTQRGEDIQISTELVDTAQNKVIWGQRYERKLTDVLTIQKEISREISENLSLRLTGEDEVSLAKEYTSNPEAYQEYLKGKYQFEKRSPEAIQKSIDHFQKAVDLDPNYAKAWSGLANSHLVLPQYADTDQTETLDKARTLAAKAIELDSSLADARASLALILMVDRQFSEAETEYRKAIELEPRYATAHHWYALYLSFAGRNDEAVQEMKLAHELEPLSLVINRNYANTLYFAGRYKEAEEQARKTAEMDAGFSEAAFVLGLSLAMQEKFSEAIDVMEKAKADGDKQIEVYLGMVHGLAGSEAQARRSAEAVLSGDRINEARLAMLYAAIGENSRALDLLDTAFEKKSIHLLFATADPILNKLKNEPRYQALLERIGYPE
ncbi:MAG: hypothetical protein DWQ47_00795 [Acidobacteria bacterium]|nr:MAG: hypothetical protein DWQ32_11255 [Acidobacteriota bacterium]REK04043.1 MAG: hypothetical protein DWQ38_00780 [Acidobacteriota bacterium]REK15205.1 MAG: hypothetical protein DWQ43_16945 [Acidobacteriota bacterium]REK46295.1 MAG: hypothetical protein DWQ47_00795 [Acidobacteriota bacterium]